MECFLLVSSVFLVAMNIFVSNLSPYVKQVDLKGLFEVFGTVSSAKVVFNRDTGISKGFGFVEMPDQAQAKKAMEKINGQYFHGRVLTVKEARKQKQ
jgi:RNA recognition motif-containing protein